MKWKQIKRREAGKHVREAGGGERGVIWSYSLVYVGERFKNNENVSSKTTFPRSLTVNLKRFQLTEETGLGMSVRMFQRRLTGGEGPALQVGDSLQWVPSCEASAPVAARCLLHSHRPPPFLQWTWAKDQALQATLTTSASAELRILKHLASLSG